MKRRAIALLSGGLDSTLAARLIKDMGVEITAVNFKSPFCLCDGARNGGCGHIAARAAKEMGIDLRMVFVGDEYIEMIKAPKFGYGKNLNPCLDCRIFIFKKAKEFMEETGASFIITGEVLGQRPMSQRRDAMNIIDRESGLKGYVLRPLSAKLLEPTIPEKEGIIDREKLLEISGRSRKPQMRLVEELDLHNFACPAGGCLLTDRMFANRMRDILKYNDSPSLNDISLLKVGRHFRISPDCKIIIGRNHLENEKIRALSRPEDCLFSVKEFKGPLALGRGRITRETIALVASIIARYSKIPGNESVRLGLRKNSREEILSLKIQLITDNALQELRI